MFASTLPVAGFAAAQQIEAESQRRDIAKRIVISYFAVIVTLALSP
jgi:hypothetical protein